MTLSERLAEARRQREAGAPSTGAAHPTPTPSEESDPPLLRSEALDDAPPLIDLTRPSAPLRPVPGPTGAAVGNAGLELPPWASGQQAYRVSEEPAGASTGAGLCVNCGGEPRVDVLDMLGGMVHLECSRCGFKWREEADPR